MEIIVKELSDLQKVATQIQAFAQDRHIWLFSGEIGAGKTTLIQRICAINGVEEKVTSPTFSLINQYEGTDGLIYHLDLYRLENMEEAIDIGIEDLLFGKNLCMIEWPDIIEPLLPDDVLKINIEIIEDSKRKVILL